MRIRSLVVASLTWLIFAAAAAGAYWYWWAGQLESGIADWTAAQALRGYRISYVGPEIGGFPLAHEARFEAPSIEAPDGSRWEGSALSGRSALWDPQTVAVSFAGRQQLEGLKFGRLTDATLDSRQADGVVQLRTDGRIESAEAELQGLDLTAAPLGHFLAEWLRVSLAPGYDPETGAVAGNAFTAEIRDLELPPELSGPLDPQAEELQVEGVVEGVIPNTDPRLALTLWREAGGTLDLERVAIEWAPLGLTASGELTLDPQLRPEGLLKARIAGLGELIGRMGEQGRLSKDQVAITQAAIAAFSSQRDARGRAAVDLPISLREGYLFVGPLRLARISPVL